MHYQSFADQMFQMEARVPFKIVELNEQFHKLQRVYRYCIKSPRHKTRIIQYIYRMMHQALDAYIYSDKIRKYDISESIIQHCL